MILGDGGLQKIEIIGTFHPARYNYNLNSLNPPKCRSTIELLLRILRGLNVTVSKLQANSTEKDHLA